MYMLRTTYCLLLVFASFIQPYTVIWKIEGKGLSHPSYLFGIKHDYDGDAFTKAHPKVLELLKQCSSVVLEVTPGQSGTGLDPSQMYFGGDSTLKQITDAATYDTITRFILEKSNGNKELVEQAIKMKPQIIHLLLGELLSDTTVSASVSMDNFLAQHAVDPQGLETYDERTTQLLSGINYALTLQEILNTIRGKKPGNEYYDMAIDYALDKESGKDFGGNKGRNINWLKKLPGLMQQQSCFIAVGIDHLRTKDGLITGLRKLGYKVSPVTI